MRKTNKNASSSIENALNLIFRQKKNNNKIIIIIIIYKIVPEGVVEIEEIKVLWDINVQCHNVIEARRPDIIVIDRKERKGIINDITIPAEVRVGEKEREKGGKYQDLKREIGRLWKLKKVEFVPVVIGALGSVTKDLIGGLKS